MTRWIAFAAFSSLVWAQEFEVASIKPSPPSSGPRTPMKADPAIVAYNSLSAKIFIQLAYKAPAWGISGGPKWMDSEPYDLRATLPPGASNEQVPRMLQALLIERFKLAVRRETRQMPIYELAIAKNGPKLKPGETGEQWSNGTFKGGIFKGRLELHQFTMGALAELLGSQTGRPVIDKTNLKETYDINLKWTPEDVPAGDGGGPSLYTAIEEQLGLKLTSAKGPVEVLVVTHIEKPSDN
jgi:uncharacterized protein (TIGR03435 family)